MIHHTAPLNRTRCFPNGNTFPASAEDVCIIEDASFLYADLPDFGSLDKAMTFGISLITDDNLTLGPLTTVTMDLETEALGAALELVYFENGPWDGIVFHLGALVDDRVVASDEFTIANGGGRDNIAVGGLSLTWDTPFRLLKFYARFGSEFSRPRAMIR